MSVTVDKELKDYLEECYQATCTSLMKNQMLLKNVEAGIIKLDPSEGIDHVKRTIGSLTKTRELLERQFKKWNDDHEETIS